MIIQQQKYRQFILCHQEKLLASLFVLLFLFCHCIFAMEHNGRGVKAIGMSNAFVAVADNSWAIVYNPAGISQLDNSLMSFFYVPSQFGVPELSTKACSGVFPASFGNLGFKLEEFGFALYSETEFGIAYSRYLDKKVGAGLCLNYNHLQIAKYGNVQTLYINAGLIGKITDEVRTGFCFSNIARYHVTKKSRSLPQTLSMGVCWLPNEDLELSVEWEKDIEFPASIKFGIQQVFFDVLMLCAGVANKPDKYSFGIFLTYADVGFGLAEYYHFDLGWTCQLEIFLKK